MTEETKVKKTNLLILVIVLLSTLPASSAHADAAPPEAPPGTTLLPGESITQVRMIAETVTLTITKHPADPQRAIANTEAVFTMRNLGTQAETMAVRFPLSFFNGNSDGYGGFPEIPSIAIRVDKQTVLPRREIQPFTSSEFSYKEREDIPWAVFDVTFPPEQDVIIEVIYIVDSFGYFPYQAFKYILETGAGWNGTIGSAEIIVRLPYEVNEKNLDLTGQAGHGETTIGGVISGNEIRWSFTDLEPTYTDNIQVVVVTPSQWEKVLLEKDNVSRNPNDGEAWGRLAKAYKDTVRVLKGYLREDTAGMELYLLSKDAYERCLALLPNDPLWHYGYADLLWTRYYFGIHIQGREDTEGLIPVILSELHTVLELDPTNQQAKDILLSISYTAPELVRRNDDLSFTLLGLTATPVPPTPWVATATPTLIPAAATPTATFTMGVIPPNTPEPTASNPLCGSMALLPVLFGMVLIVRRKAK